MARCRWGGHGGKVHAGRTRVLAAGLLLAIAQWRSMAHKLTSSDFGACETGGSFAGPAVVPTVPRDRMRAAKAPKEDGASSGSAAHADATSRSDTAWSWRTRSVSSTPVRPHRKSGADGNRQVRIHVLWRMSRDEDDACERATHAWGLGLTKALVCGI